MVKSAARALQLVELLADARRGMSHSAIASALGIPKSSLTALLGELLEKDYVELDAERRLYFLGPAVVGLARHYLARIDILGIAQPVVARIAERLDFSCSLTIRRDDEVLVVCKQAAMNPRKHSMQLGARAPVHASAGGKAVLAALGPEAIEDYLDRADLRAITRHTLTDRAALRTDLLASHRSGIGYSREELIEGIFAMAAPVFNAEGQPVAGLSVSIPADGATPEVQNTVRVALFHHAADISRRLGAAPGLFRHQIDAA